MFQDKLNSYKGYGFDYDLDYEDDNCKTNHWLILPSGKREYIDFSPYFNCSQAAFEAWIDTGMPNARSFSYDWKFK